MIEFQYPWLFLVLPIPYLVRRFLPPMPPSDQGAVLLPQFAHWREIADHSTASNPNKKLRMGMLILFWLSLVSAGANPQLLGDPVQLPLEGRDLLIAVDLSGSMERQDFELNGKVVDRLTAVKHVLDEFINKRQGDRLGLILFGRQAYVQTPLTFDLSTVRQMLAESEIGLAGQETAIGDALGLAIKRLRAQKHDEKVLVLLTDGQNTAGQVGPLDAAQLAAELGIKIYTVGIGADRLEVETLFGSRFVDPSTDLDEDTLRFIAQKTGGHYYRAKDSANLARIYEELDRLEPVKNESKTFRPKRSVFFWPLGLALLLLTLLLYRHRAMPFERTKFGFFHRRTHG